MDEIEKKGIEYYECVYKTLLSRELTGEAVIPDAVPDAERVLCAQATLYIRSSAVSEGRAALEGVVQGTVLFLAGGDGTPVKTELTLPFTLEAADTALTEAAEMTYSAALGHVEARLLNSRKLSLRADVAAELAAYRTSSLELTMRTEDPTELETLGDRAEIGYISSITHKSFSVSGDITLSEEQGRLSQLLTCEAALSVGDSRRVGAKMIVQGTALLYLSWLSTENGQLRCGRFEVPFSQILDISETDTDAAIVTVTLASGYVEPLPGINGTSEIGVELHLNAQTVCTAVREIEYTADAYCLRHPCRIETQTASVCRPFRERLLHDTVRETIELPERAAEVVYADAKASLPVLTDGAVRVPIRITAVVRGENGELWPAERRVDLEMKYDDMSAGDCLTALPFCGDISAAPTSGGIELTAGVGVRTLSSVRWELSYVSAAETDRETVTVTEDEPSVVVVRRDGRTLWSLAKSYGSTVETIEAANADNSGALLLIPRAR